MYLKQDIKLEIFERQMKDFKLSKTKYFGFNGKE